MDPTQEESIGNLQPRLKKLFRKLLKPLGVKSLVITHADRYTVRGVLMTVCPIEKRESGRDFEIGLEGKPGGSILYVSVDGRRLFPKRLNSEVSKRDPRRPRSIRLDALAQV